MDPRHLTVAALAGVTLATTTAQADCPTDIRDMAPVGFLASQTKALLAPNEPDTAGPVLEARVGAAGTMQASDGAAMAAAGSEVGGTAAIGGEVRARRGSLAGCASADVIDVRDASAHVTASGQVPLLFAGLAVGLTLDRDVVLPLAARPEYLRAPVSRFAVQFSFSFLDFDLTDRDNKLRVLVAPFAIEDGAARQDEASVVLDRRTARLELDMMRFIARDASGSRADIGLFGIDVHWTEPAMPSTDPMPSAEDATRGFARFSLLSIATDGPLWDVELDGGVLSLAGLVECDSCAKGWGRVAVGRSWQQWSLEGRIERDAFIAADNLPAVENRASATVTAESDSGATRGTVAAFAADTHAWLDGTGGQRVGLRTSLSRDLGHGFVGVLDSEIVRSNAATPELASGARLLVSLGWHKATARF